MMRDRKVLKVRRYKAGYEIREELVSGAQYGCKDFIMKSAYTPSGDYIGDSKSAYRLCKKMGLALEKISDTHNVCSIGFCEKEQKWYGWSHRAIFGFGIGSKCKKGDCGFTPRNVLELFGSFSEHERNNIAKVDVNGITIRHDNVQQIPAEPNVGEQVEWVEAEPSYQIIDVGRGEWTAKTIEDAKLMAIDFARGVS